MKQGDSLDQLGSTLLYRLWKRHVDGDGTLVTAEELRQLLPEDVGPRAIKRALQKLQRDGYVQCAKAPRGHSGPSPLGYKFAPDPHLITHRSTAHIVLKLLNHPRRLVPEQTFVDEVMELHLHRDDTGAALTPDDVRNQLRWCVDQGYFERFESANDPENPEGQRRICTTAKVHGEVLLLGLLCGRKGPVSVDRASPKAVESLDRQVSYGT